MNKKIILFGIVVFIIAFLLPPFKYTTIGNLVSSQRTGLPLSLETTFLPFWHNGNIYHEENLIGTGAKIDTGLWYGILGGIAFLTFALGIVFKKKEDNS